MFSKLNNSKMIELNNAHCSLINSFNTSWSKFLLFARVPECQKLKMVG